MTMRISELRKKIDRIEKEMAEDPTLKRRCEEYRKKHATTIDMMTN